jgi:hypothetical protein
MESGTSALWVAIVIPRTQWTAQTHSSSHRKVWRSAGASVVSRNSRAVGGEGVEDLVGGLGPGEGFGVGVPFVDPLADVGFEFGDAAVGGTRRLRVVQFGEPALDQVEPRRAGWGEVQLAARRQSLAQLSKQLASKFHVASACCWAAV